MPATGSGAVATPKSCSTSLHDAHPEGGWRRSGGKCGGRVVHCRMCEAVAGDEGWLRHGQVQGLRASSSAAPDPAACFVLLEEKLWVVMQPPACPANPASRSCSAGRCRPGGRPAVPVTLGPRGGQRHQLAAGGQGSRCCPHLLIAIMKSTRPSACCSRSSALLVACPPVGCAAGTRTASPRNSTSAACCMLGQRPSI